MEKNNSLHVENTSLEPLLNKLQSLQVYFGGDQLLADMPLSEYDDQSEDEEYLSYSLHDVAEIPHECINDLGFYISGVLTEYERNFSRDVPELTILWDSEKPSIELVLQIANHVTVTGVLQNCVGMLDDMQSEIDSNRHAISFCC